MTAQTFIQTVDCGKIRLVERGVKLTKQDLINKYENTFRDFIEVTEIIEDLKKLRCESEKT